MKKLFAVLFVAAVMVAGLFAEEFPKGTWTDPNYDAEWVIGLDMKIRIDDRKCSTLFKEKKMCHSVVHLMISDSHNIRSKHIHYLYG